MRRRYSGRRNRHVPLSRVVRALEHWQSPAAVGDRAIPDDEWANAARYVAYRFGRPAAKRRASA